MSKKRKSSLTTFSDEPPIKRRKKSSLHDNHNMNNNSDIFEYENDNNDKNGEYACFHFNTFRELNGPHPCLYKTCNDIEFESWSLWKQHWIQKHRQQYIDNNQMIPINEFNENHSKIKLSSFRHLNFLTILGSTNASKSKLHCILTFDLSTIYSDNFNISYFRNNDKLIWDPLNYKQHRLDEVNEEREYNHCNPSKWDRIRSANHCAKHVEYFNNSRILFRCGGYYSSTKTIKTSTNYNNNNNDDDYNEMGNNSLSPLCDAFDIDNKQHYPLPNLSEPLHSSSSIYINSLKCLLNIGGDDYNGKPINYVNALFLNEKINNDHHLKWNKKIFPKMLTKRSYRPSLGLYKDKQSLILFVSGGCNTNYDGLKNFESLDLTKWIKQQRKQQNIDDNNTNNKEKKEEKEEEEEDEDDDINNNKYNKYNKWIKQKNMNIPRRDASNLLHWRSQNVLVCCGGDHGEGTVRCNSIKPWYTSEMYDFSKTKWLKLPNFPYQTSHAQNPFIWIEGGMNDNNYWSGIRETKIFKKYSSFDATHGVLCVVGNGFCSKELGFISFYDPRINKWQSGGKKEENWLSLETNYLGTLHQQQELRHICAL